MTKYDDASWHLGGDFPKGLSRRQSMVHMGMFLGWAISEGAIGEYLLERHGKSLEAFRRRELTGAQIVEQCCDECLTNEDFNVVGNEFAHIYYEPDIYIDDYESEFGNEVSSLYEVFDNWDNFERIQKQVQKRFNVWRQTGLIE